MQKLNTFLNPLSESLNPFQNPEHMDFFNGQYRFNLLPNYGQTYTS